MRLERKVAVITGASEGIGAACAVELARAGARLSLTARSEVGLRAAAAATGSPDTLITPGDITHDETRRAVVARTLERFGAIDLLINNAGAGLYLPSWNAPLEEARRLMELNFFALLGMTQMVAAHMCSRRSGMIVNVSSIAGKVPLPWMTLYSASKFAVGALTEGLRMELRRHGVRTLVVCPGYVRTAFQEHARGGQPPDALVRARRFSISAADCAAAIRRGVERDRRTVVTPPAGWVFILAMRLFPSFVESRMAAINQSA